MDAFKGNENTIPENALIITRTDIPFIRAGIGNLYIFILAMFLKVGLFFVKEFEIPIIGSIVMLFVILYLLRHYFATLSKLHFYKHCFRVVTTVGTTNIDINNIEHTRLTASPSSFNAFISLKFKLRGKFLAGVL